MGLERLRRHIPTARVLRIMLQDCSSASASSSAGMMRFMLSHVEQTPVGARLLCSTMSKVSTVLFKIIACSTVPGTMAGLALHGNRVLDCDTWCEISTRCCQPKALRFKGRSRLKVTPATTPGNIDWTHISHSPCSKLVRRLITWIPMAVRSVLGHAVAAA